MDDANSSQDAVRASLIGAEWVSDAHKGAFIRFDAEGRVAGSGGCNNFFGNYELGSFTELKIGPLASTKKACPGEVMQIESAFFQALEQTSSFRRGDFRLTLWDADGQVALELYRADWD